METLRAKVPEILKAVRATGKFEFLHYEIKENVSADQVRELATSLTQALEARAGVVAVTATVEDKVVLIVATTTKAREASASSGSLVKLASAVLGGGGGGKDNIAQGGGPLVSKLKEAVAAIEKELGA